MNAVQKRRLLKLSEFLYCLPAQKFDLDVIVRPGLVSSGEKYTDCDGEVCDVMNDVFPNNKNIKQKDCGAAACAIGYCPVVFPRSAKYDTDESVIFNVGHNDGDNFYGAELFFGLTTSQANYLFLSESYHDSKRGPKSVAARIRSFVDRDGYIRPNTKAAKQDFYV